MALKAALYSIELIVIFVTVPFFKVTEMISGFKLLELSVSSSDLTSLLFFLGVNVTIYLPDCFLFDKAGVNEE